MTIRVYCEHGAFREELWRLQQEGVIDLVYFPYEARMNKKYQRGHPSEVIWKDLSHVQWEEMNFPCKEMARSDKFKLIRKILGSPRLDALHIDSAYKSRCSVFLSRDHHHIIANAQELENLLGIRFFHPDENWDDFLAFVREHMESLVSP
jgi:hypothetical protein